MDFGGWHGCGYCDYGGGCWPVPWWVCLVVVGFFSLVSWLGLFGDGVGFSSLVPWWVGGGGVVGG